MNSLVTHWVSLALSGKERVSKGLITIQRFGVLLVSENRV
jgi:hypothetical protein